MGVNGMEVIKMRHGVEYLPLPPLANIVEEYWINEPFAKVMIVKEPYGAFAYYVCEEPLSSAEERGYQKIKEFLEKELNPKEVFTVEDVKSIVIENIERIFAKYGKKICPSSRSQEKIRYFLIRDLLGFGAIDVLMRDPEIEDISCNGINKRVYVWHRRYESTPTNIVFREKEALDSLIIILSHKAGKHISSAHPIIDGMLYGRDRIAGTFREEISPKGSSFTIRRFKTEPFSIVDLIKLGYLSPQLAGYFWEMLEKRMSLIVIGGTATGKTTFLNAIACLIKPGLKIVTVEETPELNLPHENWVQLVSRSGFGIGDFRVGEISLFDLVKISLRYRPDYLIVGEIRGEEAYVLFQALATGHGALSTLHAENIDYMIKRLTSRPMNIDKAHIPLMNIVCLSQRVYVPSKQRVERRLRNVWEITPDNELIPIASWQPNEDVIHANLEESYLLNMLSHKHAVTKVSLIESIYEKANIIENLVKRNIRSIPHIALAIQSYYAETIFKDKYTNEALGSDAITIDFTNNLDKNNISNNNYQVLDKLNEYYSITNFHNFLRNAEFTKIKND